MNYVDRVDRVDRDKVNMVDGVEKVDMVDKVDEVDKNKVDMDNVNKVDKVHMVDMVDDGGHPAVAANPSLCQIQHPVVGHLLGAALKSCHQSPKTETEHSCFKNHINQSCPTTKGPKSRGTLFSKPKNVWFAKKKY